MSGRQRQLLSIIHHHRFTESYKELENDSRCDTQILEAFYHAQHTQAGNDCQRHRGQVVCPGVLAQHFQPGMHGVDVVAPLFDRELIGLGLANLAAGLVSGYPVTGGFSRTAVNYQAGARTPLASVVTAGLVLLSLLALTPLFACLPTAALSAVIVSAVAGLVDLREAARLFRIKRGDGWIFLATFLTTLGLGVSRGLVAGILLSLLLFVARSSRPRTVVLGRLAGRNEYRDLARHPEAETFPDLILIRVDASLYFANARFVEDRVLERLALQPAARWVVMDMSGVNDIDAAAVMTLDALMEACAARGVGFAFAGIKAAQMALWAGADDFDGTIVEEKIGHAAGADSPKGLTIAELTEVIAATGFTPVQRDTFFEELGTAVETEHITADVGR